MLENQPATLEKEKSLVGGLSKQGIRGREDWFIFDSN